MNGLKLGAVRYLNTKPLIHELEELAPWVELVLDTPGKLAELLKEGQIDCGLIPAIEYARMPRGGIIPGISIASTGEVWSVLLVSNRPRDEIRTLALDTSSRSSVAMAKVLCSERFGLRPRYLDRPPDPGVLDAEADALLLIGDPAMQLDLSRFSFIYDLGLEWQELTQVPFVYAFWVTRSDEPHPELVQVLSEAKARGLRALPEISAAESTRLGLSKDRCLEYLREKIGFELGDRELSGLKDFYGRAAAMDLCPERVPLRFV